MHAGHGPRRRPVTASRQPVSTELVRSLARAGVAVKLDCGTHSYWRILELLRHRRDRLHRQASGCRTAEARRHDLRAGARGLAREARRAGPAARRPRGEDPGGGGRSLQARARRGGIRPADRPSLPPGGCLRHRGGRGRLGARERRGHPARDRVRERARRRPLPPRQLDRRGGQLRGHLPGGHVRRGAEAAPPLPPHQVRVGATGARGRRDEDARVPPGDRGRPFGDRRDGQDRRSLLLLQAAPEAAPRAAGVVPARRPGGRADEHRAGGLRGARDGPHLAPAGRRAAGRHLPPGEPGAHERGRDAQRVREGRPRARSSRCAWTRT